MDSPRFYEEMYESDGTVRQHDRACVEWQAAKSPESLPQKRREGCHGRRQ